MYKLVLALVQRFAKQTLPRKPEMDMVMMDRQQDAEYNRDGEDGALAIVYDLVVNAIRRIAPASGEALDICCGSAQLLCKVAKSLPEIHFTGIDYSNHMLEFARENKNKYSVANVDFQKGDMYRLSEVWGRQFDLVTWHFALHHCDREEDVIKVFNQIARLVKENGSVFIFDICRPKTGKLALHFAEIYNRMWGEWFYQDSLDSYKAAFTYEELESLLARSDLKNYRHVQPVIGNVFQAIIIGHEKPMPRQSISYLKHIWQKMDSFLLKQMFAGRL